MKAHTLPAAAGWHWIKGGYAIYRRNPVMLLLLVVFYWAVVLLLNLVPALGPWLASIGIPGLSAGLMFACRDIEQGKPAAADTLFAAFRANLRSMLLLGVLYGVLTLLVLVVASVIDGGELMRYLTTGKKPPGDVDLLAPLVLLSLLVPLMMAYWFGPMLAAWHSLPAVKALFFSLVACLLNWRAFAAYGLALAAIGLIGPLLVLTLAALISPVVTAFLSALLGLPLLVVLMPVTFASFYVSYREVFGVSEHA